MKINQIIRKKRKELSLTQEEVAEYLGVSTPAVNKWEKGSAYPDITILPALARLLKTDLNTLMSFKDDLTDIEIEKFVNELDIIAESKSYEEAFQTAINKIHQYPTCEKLIFYSVLYLEGALFLCGVSEQEKYRNTLKKFYERMSRSKDTEIQETAINMLISYNRNKGNFAKAEELINAIPASKIDREGQFAILYMSQKQYQDAKKIWEHRIINSITKIQTSLINMVEIALKEDRIDDAIFFADTYKIVSEQFEFPKWLCYNAHLAISLEKQDKADCLAILKEMLPAMKDEWNHKNCRLYKNINGSSATFLSKKLADIILDELISKDEFAFIRGNSEFDELIANNKKSNKYSS